MYPSFIVVFPRRYQGIEYLVAELINERGREREHSLGSR